MHGCSKIMHDCLGYNILYFLTSLQLFSCGEWWWSVATTPAVLYIPGSSWSATWRLMKMLCGVWNSQNIVLHSDQRLHSALYSFNPLLACQPTCCMPALMHIKNQVISHAVSLWDHDNLAVMQGHKFLLPFSSWSCMRIDKVLTKMTLAIQALMEWTSASSCSWHKI